MNRKKLVFPLLLLMIVGLIAGGYLTRLGNVHFRVISGQGGMPPGEYSGALIDGDAEVVVTEPFRSLNNWESAKVIRRVKIVNGVGSAFLLPGKYGVYLEIDNRKILYDKLDLTPYDPNEYPGSRGDRGDWYIQVTPLTNTVEFSIDKSPS